MMDEENPCRKKNPNSKAQSDTFHSVFQPTWYSEGFLAIIETGSARLPGTWKTATDGDWPCQVQRPNSANTLVLHEARHREGTCDHHYCMSIVSCALIHASQIADSSLSAAESALYASFRSTYRLNMNNRSMCGTKTQHSRVEFWILFDARHLHKYTPQHGYHVPIKAQPRG